MQSFFRGMKRKETDAQLLFLGIDNSGKTTLIKRLAGEDINAVFPTKGYNVHIFPFKQSKVHVCDIGGALELRRYWGNHFGGKDALVFVIDSSDRARLEEAGQTLFDVLSNDKVAGLPLVIFANKQEQLHAIEIENIKAGLNLHSIRDRRWTMIGSSAVTGQGLEEGIDYLLREINHSSGRLKS